MDHAAKCDGSYVSNGKVRMAKKMAWVKVD